MTAISNDDLIAQAKAILKDNDRGKSTVPSPDLYPHQWLWDSCFIAIGLRHYEPRRAAQEIQSLLRGQWRNGMLPNVILSSAKHYWADERIWQSQLSPSAPSQPKTSALTQPPMIAIACLAIAAKLPVGEKQHFLKSVFPALLAYHRWIYSERDPQQTGLAVLVHPWESGLDNSPPWMYALRSSLPIWLSAFFKFKLDRIVKRFRRDIKFVPDSQRIRTTEALRMTSLFIKYRRQRYDSQLMLKNNNCALEDLAFNSILIHANRDLAAIAELIAEEIPAELHYRFSRTETALERLWDEETGQYYSRLYKSRELVKIPSIATLLPLYSGAITPERAGQLLALLTDDRRFWSTYPVPTVPLDSKDFQQKRYWQGPTWINMNWLIIKGLLNYGFNEEAASLTHLTKQVIANHGFHEYFSPLDGQGYGIDNFSWTAALLIDLLAEQSQPLQAGQKAQVIADQPR